MVVALVVCIIIILALLIKLIVMKRSARMIADEFREIINSDTNALIHIPSTDPDMKKLAASLNGTLADVRNSYHRYREGDAEVKRTLTNVSHDLRTPLTAICGHIDLLKEEKLDPEVEKTINIIEERAHYMKQLTEELFEFSVIMSTSEELPKEENSINLILENVIIDFYGALTKRGIEPQVNITENKVIRNVNKKQMDRVFSNLMSNALKYSKGDLEVSLSDEGVVVFANKAPGLDKLQVEKLFNRFYTVESARNSTGIGLSIAKKFVEENGGSIKAEYEDEKLIITIAL